jgi:hypothetical protein
MGVHYDETEYYTDDDISNCTDDLYDYYTDDSDDTDTDYEDDNEREAVMLQRRLLDLEWQLFLFFMRKTE